MAKAFSYLRFSTPEQMSGDSFRRQTELAADYARKHDLDLDTALTFRDLGVSAFRGANADSGRLGDFLAAVREGLVPRGSFLLVESLDRLSRLVPRHAMRGLENICAEGITVVTLVDGKRYTEADLDNPIGFLTAFIVSMRANEESETKSRRLKAAWAKMRREAHVRPITARGPAWLELSAKKRWRVLEERAAVVRKVFDLARSGAGAHSIVERLNRQCVATFGTGLRWHRSSVVRLLSNPAVVGTFVPHELVYDGARRSRLPLEPVTGYYPAIVDPETYETVQTLSAVRGSARGRHSGKEVRSILAGLAKCPKCGSTMTRVTKGKRGGAPYVGERHGGRDMTTVNINGTVLKELRENRGFSISGLAKLVKAEPQRIERNDEPPPYGLVKKFADVLSVPSLVFGYTQTPPEALLSIPDFRTRRGAPAKLGPKATKAIFEAKRLQAALAELIEDDPDILTSWVVENLPDLSLEQDPAEAASSIRKLLGITTDDQIGRGAPNFLQLLRYEIERRGIVVLARSYPLEDSRGFCLFEPEQPPTIVFNTQEHSGGARAFTLVHELGHVLLRQTGISDFTRSLNRTEVFCNAFAASFLMPSDLVKAVFTADVRIRARRNTALAKMAERLQVTQDALAIRLEQLSFVDDGFRSDWISQFSDGQFPEPPRFGRSSAADRKLAQLGVFAANAALVAADRGLLTPLQLFSLTKLKPDQANEVRTAMENRIDKMRDR